MDERGQGEFIHGYSLRYIKISKYGKEWHSTLHTHSCTELFYCIRGSGKFKFSDCTLPVVDDDMVIVNPNVEHTELSLKDNPLEYIVLGIDSMEFNYREEERDNRYFHYNCHASRSTLLFYLYALLHEENAKQAEYTRVCHDLLEVLLIELMRQNNLRFSVTEVQRVNKECAAVKRYIDTYFRETITLGSLAQMVHLNKYYLIHTFHNEYGISPMSYLLERRISESKYLLVYTNHSLTQISRIVGFSSPSYFSQSFRKVVLQSPMEYRRLKQKNDGKAE